MNTLLRLALAEKDCPGNVQDEPESPNRLHRHPDCIHGCKGTGRVPLLPELREPRCSIQGSHWHRTVHYNPSRGKPCDEGWVVTTNPETIARRLWGVLKGLRDTAQKFDYRWYMGAGRFGEAWEAAACALEEAGLLEKETP